MNAVSIKCPACPQGLIMLQPWLLLNGAQFCCHACGACISLSADCTDILKSGLESIEELKSEALKQLP